MTTSMSTQPVRRLLRRGLSIALAVMLILTAMPAAFADPGDLESIVLNCGDTKTLEIGETFEFWSTANYEPGGTIVVGTFSIECTDDSVVRVEEAIAGVGGRYVVTAKAPGTSKVILTLTQDMGDYENEASDSVVITVNPPPPVPPEGVSFTPEDVEIIIPYDKASETATVNYAVYPSNVDPNSDSLSFGSSNPAVVTISKSSSDEGTGTLTLTGLEAGSATVTATTSNGKSATLHVTVSKQIPATSLSLSSTSVTMAVGETREVSADILPTNYNYPASIALTASAAPASIVGLNVDQTTRKVTLEALAPGSTTVTVTAAGLPPQTIGVVVTNDIPATGIWVGTDTATIADGETFDISVGILPIGFNTPAANSIIITAVSSDPGVVTPDYDADTKKLTLTANAPGSAKVTLTTSNGLPPKEISVLVPQGPIPATAIWVATNDLTMANGATQVVPMGILPANFTTPSPLTIGAISSNPGVLGVSVNQTTRELTLSAYGYGSAKVTVSASGLSNQEINVSIPEGFVPATGAAFASTPVSITIPYGAANAEATVYYTLQPSNTNDIVHGVSSNKEDVVLAELDEGDDIHLTAFKEGTATVTLITDGGLSASFEVTVTKEPGLPTNVDPTEIISETPVVRLFKGDTAEVAFEVRELLSMQGAAISVSSETGNSAPALGDVEDGRLEDGGDDQPEKYVPALVHVNVLGVKTGSDLVKLNVNGVEGSVAVIVYDKILPANVSITPASQTVESGSPAAFALTGLNGLSTDGYTFLWTVPSTPAGAQISGSAAGTSAEVSTSSTFYTTAPMPVTLTVTPPTVNGSPALPPYTLTAAFEAHREGDLVLDMNPTSIATVQKLVVGPGKFIPSDAFTLKYWKDGGFLNVANPLLSYASSNTAVCTVDGNGYLTPHAPGTATITVQGYDQLDPEKAPASSSFDVVVYRLTAPGEVDVRTGVFLTIPGVIEPSGYIFYKITLPSPLPSTDAAYVSEDVFYAKTAGLYTLTAYAYPSYEAYLADLANAAPLTKTTILVRATADPTALTMNATPIDLHIGETYIADLTKAPYNTIYDPITHGAITGWVSANSSALGVQGDVISGLAECANQYVYANTANGYRLYFAFNVVVNHVATVQIASSGDEKMFVGETRLFAATITPSTADDKTVLWSTLDDSIAAVDEFGNVEAKAAGSTILYAKSPEGPGDSLILTVIEQPNGIMLSNTYLEGYPGASLPLTYQVLPEGAVVHHVDWKYNPALTDAQWIEGLLVLPATAAPGDYVITVEVYGPGLNDQGQPTDEALLGTDQCLLRVLQPVTSVALANIAGIPFGPTETLKGIVGTSTILRANILPANAVDKTLVWDVDDESVATVEPIPPLGTFARVTFHATGSTNVIVKSATSPASASILAQVVKAVTDFSLTPNYMELYPGESFTYDVTLVPSDTMLIDKIDFSSDAPAVADVDVYGRVTAIFPATDPVTIEAEYDNKLYQFQREATVVVKNPVDKLEFTGITTTPLNLAVGASYDLYSKLTFTGLNTAMPVADTKVTWLIENSGVVSIDPNGIVRADGVGETWVFACAHNGVIAKLRISVQQSAQSLTLDAYDVAIRVGETATIRATVLPVESTDVLEWTLGTDQTFVEKTNSDSRSFSLRGVLPGVTTLTATTKNAATDAVTATKTCTITVKQPVTSITVDTVPELPNGSYPKTLTATHIGQSIALLADVLPANAYDKSVTWSVVDTAVATIDPITGVLLAKGVGTTTAIARSNSDPDVIGILHVVVVRGLLTLSVDPDEKSIYVGDRFTITPLLLPEGSVMPPVVYEATSLTPPAVPVTLTPSTVNGVPVCKVLGAAAGKATVTAYIFKGTPDEISATCHVEVLVPLTTFTVKKDRIRMLVGDAFRYDLADDLQFNGGLPAPQPNDKTAVYTSLDPTIAAVDNYGQITAKRVGTTVINIVPNANPTLRAQVTVEVVDLAAGVIADAAEIRVYPGQKIPVNFSFVPEAIATTDFEWSYFDEDGSEILPEAGGSIAYYDGGFVYAMSPGFVKLEATVEIPQDIETLYAKYPTLKFKEVKTSILVTVLTPVESVVIDSLDGVDMNPTELETLTYHVGERFVLGASVTPPEASDPEIFWTSSDTNIASVDAFGIVSANGTGTVKIYATSKNTGVQDVLTLVVEKAPFARRYGVATVSGLFVRKKPSLQGSVYKQYKKGTKVTIVGQYGEWYEILYSKSSTGVAYVHKHYIRITGYVDPQPLVSAPGDILTESNAAISSKTTVWANPGSGYRTTAPAGTRVMVVGSSGSYYAITYGHYNLGTGYVLASRVTKDADFPLGKIIKGVPNGTGGYESFLIDPGTGAAVPLEGDTQVVNIPSSVTATSAPIYSGFEPATRVLIGRVYKGAMLTIISEKLNGFYQVRLASGIIGWVDATFLAQPSSGGVETTVSVTTYVGKATTNVNIRKSASASSSKVGSLKKGKTIQLVSMTKYNGFYKVVTSSGVSGYIMAKYLKTSTQVKQQTTITPIFDQYGFVNCKLLNVRETAAMDGVIIGTLLANQKVVILDELNGWYHVERADGSLGFVKTEYITLIEA